MLEEAFCTVVFPVHAVQADSFQFTLNLSFRDAAAAVGVFQRVRYRKRFAHDRASHARAAYHCGRSARRGRRRVLCRSQLGVVSSTSLFHTLCHTPKARMGGPLLSTHVGRPLLHELGNIGSALFPKSTCKSRPHILLVSHLTRSRRSRLFPCAARDEQPGRQLPRPRLFSTRHRHIGLVIDVHVRLVDNLLL